MMPDNPLEFRESTKYEFEIEGVKIPLTSLSFSQSIDNLCGSFEAVTSSEYALYIFENVGKSLNIGFLGKKRECVLDAVSMNLPGEVTLSGRDKTSLLVDSSADVFHFPKEQSFLSIAKKLCEPYDVEVLDPEKLAEFQVLNFSITPGDCVFESLSEAASQGGVFLSSHNGASLVVRSEKNSEKTLEINDKSPLLGIQIQKNTSEVYGVYVGLTKGKKSKNKKMVLKDTCGHTLKKKYFTLEDIKDPEKTLVLEAKTRRRRSLSIQVEFAGSFWCDLGSVVGVNVKGFKSDAVIHQIDYLITPTDEKTSVILGGL